MHVVQALPPPPHALLSVPAAQVLSFLQQPVQELTSQTQPPATQCWPVPHVPVAQTPPQPSVAPQAFAAQLGVQPQTPVAPHVSGEVHALPSQHGWPLPPHAPHALVPHVAPDGHGTHTAPPLPQAPLSVPAMHDVPLQQPAHELVSQTHPPLTQCWPVPQLPVMHTPPHPSLAPHALAAQLGVQPHTPVVPPPPQVRGDAHARPAQHA
jgi:hypothetical protein